MAIYYQRCTDKAEEALPVNLIEMMYYTSNDDLEVAFYIEGLTNDRLRNDAGTLTLVDKDDWVYGPGASPVMATFTHIENPSRFTDGSWGVYYAGDSLDVSIAETMSRVSQLVKDKFF